MKLITKKHWWLSKEKVAKVMFRCPMCGENQWIKDFIDEKGRIKNLRCVNGCQFGTVQLKGYSK